VKKVYIVSHGTYSDYCIDGVFSTKEKAEAFIETFPRDSMYAKEIEVWKLDAFDDVIKAVEGKKVFQVEMDIVTGDVSKNGIKEYTGELWESQLALERKYIINKGFIEAYVFADDKEHAVKIVGEQRTRIILKMDEEKNREKGE